VPEICIGNVLNTMRMREFHKGCRFIYAFGPFPVVNHERSVRIHIHHINASGKSQFFVPDHPFGAIRNQLGIISYKPLEIGVFR
tara:strand:+ start:1775 stop:2026 length:252 start_codon:yes stop_codon:yes gene_type:complete